MPKFQVDDRVKYRVGRKEKTGIVRRVHEDGRVSVWETVRHDEMTGACSTVYPRFVRYAGVECAPDREEFLAGLRPAQR